jgi:hypothetical protein
MAVSLAKGGNISFEKETPGPQSILVGLAGMLGLLMERSLT